MRWLPIVLAVLLAAFPAQAYEPLPPQPAPQGASQQYAVVFDGEGEAAVMARLAFQNLAEQAITAVTLEVPGTAVRVLAALQEVQQHQQQCMNWQETCVQRAGEQVCRAFDEQGACISWERPCIRYDRACTGWASMPTGTGLQVVRRDEEALSGSRRVTLTLSQPIKPQQSGTLFISYKALGYARKTLGGWRFAFETLKHGSDTTTVRVAVNVQEGLTLKGGQADVAYRPSFGAFAAMEKAAVGAMASPDVQQAINSVLWAPGYVKQTSALDPWESFIVRGRYAGSWLGLHWQSLLAALLVIGLIGISIAAAVRRLQVRRWPDFLLVLGTGFAAAAAEVGLGLIAPWALERLHRVFYNEALILLAVLLTGLLMLATAFGPAVLVGVRRGPLNGFLTFAATLGGLFLLLFVIAILHGGRPPVLYAGK
jgi:hypothetical protein